MAEVSGCRRLPAVAERDVEMTQANDSNSIGVAQCRRVWLWPSIVLSPVADHLSSTVVVSCRATELLGVAENCRPSNLALTFGTKYNIQLTYSRGKSSATVGNPWIVQKIKQLDDTEQQLHHWSNPCWRHAWRSPGVAPHQNNREQLSTTPDNIWQHLSNSRRQNTCRPLS